MQDIIDTAKALPASERICIVGELLRSLDPVESSVDEAWAVECERRLEDVRTGKVTPIPGEQVFERIRERFSKA